MSAATQAWGDVSVPLHAARLRHFATEGIGETVRREGAFAQVTGALSNIENGIVSEQPDVEPAVAEELVAWVRLHDRPASWMAPVAADDRLHEALVGLGCSEETTGVDMGARLGELELPDRPPHGITIEEVLGEAELLRWAQVGDSSGLFDEADVQHRQQRLYAELGLGPGRPIRHWLAVRDGEAIGMATAFFDDGAALLEHIGVRPEAQRTGIGTALIAHWRQEARELGCEIGVLESTPDSQRFYERLGFTVTRVRPRHWYYLP